MRVEVSPEPAGSLLLLGQNNLHAKVAYFGEAGLNPFSPAFETL